MNVHWQPSLGAWRHGQDTHFRVWAPEADRIDVTIGKPAGGHEYPMTRCADGLFEACVAGLAPGDLYRYRVDGRGPYPDPASRYQPQGVHGPSQVVDPAEFRWTDQEWPGIDLDDLILYELHVGTFAPAGTFAAAAGRLPALRDLGVTAVELMPVADFAGERNWGYDGVALFAPARCYGAPDDLRSLVNAAHRLGLAVHLDVVHNHLGPDGAYLGVLSPYYFSAGRQSPWGPCINFDGPHSVEVRKFFVENALHWIHEYHIDGLRLDATHAIMDESPRHILAEIAAAVRESLAGSRRQALVIAEDSRNLTRLVTPESEQGYGLDAVWSDDFHHQMRVGLAGDRDGYFSDFAGRTADLAATIKDGWFYRGQHAPFFGGPRGTNPETVSPRRFVFFLQNHDQVGNRALGDRLHHQVDLAVWRAATTLLLLAPQTPLLFMGQEWAASTPFQFFTDHHPELGRLVTEGRRSEFSSFAAFADPKVREAIPDPQDRRTFEASRLNWPEREREPHQSVLCLYRKLLALRKTEPAMRSRRRGNFDIVALNVNTLLLRRSSSGARALLAVIRLRGEGTEDLRGHPLAMSAGTHEWEVVLTTEDASFAPDPAPPQVDRRGPVIAFARPGAVVLRAAAARES